MMYWGMGWGWLVGLIIMAAIIWLIVRSGSGFNPRSLNQSGRSNALDILNERYARGEITKEEYERMKKDIQD